MVYEVLIRDWFERSELDADSISQFLFLYISFIAFLTQKQMQSGRHDRQIIDSLKASDKAKKYYIKLIQSDSKLKDSIHDLINELKDRPIRNITRTNDTNWHGEQGALQGEDDWDNLVEFWYRVRNNLFHGHKSPQVERDKTLVHYAYLTLFPLMKHFVETIPDWEFRSMDR